MKLLRFKKSKGFSLIELLVAIAIIATLTSFLTVNFIGARQRARDAQRKSDLRQIQAALEMIRADKGSYLTQPTQAGPGEYRTATSGYSCGASVPFVWSTNTYMSAMPCDPLTTTSYVYIAPAGALTYTLTTCLENPNDRDRATTNVCGAGRATFRVQNP